MVFCLVGWLVFNSFYLIDFIYILKEYLKGVCVCFKSSSANQWDSGSFFLYSFSFSPFVFSTYSYYMSLVDFLTGIQVLVGNECQEGTFLLQNSDNEKVCGTILEEQTIAPVSTLFFGNTN